MNNKTEKTQFQKENDEVLNLVLNERFFKPFKENYDTDPKSLKHATNLELFITSDCNLKCEYCYLMRHGDKLYHKDIRNKDTILNNLKIFLNYAIEQDYKFNNIDLFTGEIWGTDFGYEVLDILLEYIDKGFKVKSFSVPTNCTFIKTDEHLNKMEEYIENFNKRYIRFMISISIDGKYLEAETRSFKNEEQNKTRDDVFYNRLFHFAAKHTFLFHPMVSSKSCKNWIQNYKWFMDNIEHNDFEPEDTLMMLEVRNDDWEDEDIQYFLEFIEFLIQHNLKRFNNINEFANYLFTHKSASKVGGYINIALPFSTEQSCCNVTNTLHLRLGDLAVVPCHRTSYDKFVYGHFDVEDDKITGLTSNNIQMAIKTLLQNSISTHHGCDVCPYNDFCIRGCFGAQYEDNNEIFTPSESVCKMFKAKYDYLIKRYTELGIFEILKKEITPTHTHYRLLLRLDQSIKKIQNYKECNGGEYNC